MSDTAPMTPRPDPSCHACGGPLALGAPVAVYHDGCDPGAQVDALTRLCALYRAQLSLSVLRRLAVQHPEFASALQISSASPQADGDNS